MVEKSVVFLETVSFFLSLSVPISLSLSRPCRRSFFQDKWIQGSRSHPRIDPFEFSQNAIISCRMRGMRVPIIPATQRALQRDENVCWQMT